MVANEVHYHAHAVVVVGFEVDQLSIEETLASDASIQVVLLENDSNRNFSIGVYTVDGSANGELRNCQH